MTIRFRRIIAGSEIAGGAAVMALTLWPSLQRTLPVWYAMSLEGLGATAIAAGLWLWRDEDRGWALSRLLQGIQIAQVLAPGFSFAVVVGLQCNLHFGATRFGIQPGFYGSLVLGDIYRGEWQVALNVFALAAFVALGRGRPSAASQTDSVSASSELEAGCPPAASRPST